MKPHSCHDDKVKYGVFKGFIYRALYRAICSEQYLKEELGLLINVFVENWYEEKTLRKIVSNFKSGSNKNNSNSIKFLSLLFIPNLKNKLRNVFPKAGFNVMFKSGRKLLSILTSINKQKLPKNS